MVKYSRKRVVMCIGLLVICFMFLSKPVGKAVLKALREVEQMETEHGEEDNRKKTILLVPTP